MKVSEIKFEKPSPDIRFDQATLDLGHVRLRVIRKTPDNPNPWGPYSAALVDNTGKPYKQLSNTMDDVELQCLIYHYLEG